jgi:hypothetical protein
MIQCKICNREFKSQITNSHLKTHDTNTSEYRLQFGDDSLSSVEYRAAKSRSMTGTNNPSFGQRRQWTAEQKEKLKGRIPHNKGVQMSDSQKTKLRDAAVSRNDHWRQTDTHPLKGRQVSDETKLKISQSISDYAAKNPEQMQSRTAKAIQTKIDRGYDFAPFKGRTHSQETKDKIIESTKQYRAARKTQTLDAVKLQISEMGLMLLNDIDEHFLSLRCTSCGYEFSRTKQIFKDSKRGVTRDVCDVCYPKDNSRSAAEIELYEYIVARGIVAESGNRSVIGPLELDIYIPSKNIAIEYCGLYWHGELNGKDRLYHLRKLELCAKAGIRLITVFEDEWINTPKIVLSRLDTILGLHTQSIYARKCEVREISPKDANEFLNVNHLQGSGRSNMRFGLFSANTLVSVMTFSKSNISKKVNEWEIDRFASRIGNTVIGGASKLFAAFVRTEQPNTVVTFADRRWSDETAFYDKLGFVLDSVSPPSYWYITGMKRLHRYSLRKNVTDDQTKTEWENRQLQGYDRIWDCGHFKYQFKIDTKSDK